MSKFERVLSDDDLVDIFALGIGELSAKPFDELVKVLEQAVLKKLAEQEPVAYLYADMIYGTGDADINEHIIAKGEPLYCLPLPCVSNASDKTACVSKNGENETQANSQGLLDSSIQVHRNLIRALALKNGFTLKGEDLHEYVYNFANELASVVANAALFDKSTKNHVVGNNEMVADMYWIDPEYPAGTSILDAFEPILSEVEVEVGDRYEVSRAKTMSPLTIEVTELEENGDVKDYKILSGDHIADMRKKVPEEWRLINTHPNKQLKELLLFNKNKIQVGLLWGSEWVDVAYNRINPQPTHWLPLPNPPKEGVNYDI